MSIKMGAHVSREPHHGDQEVDYEKWCLLHISGAKVFGLSLIFYYIHLANKIAAFFPQHGVVSPCPALRILRALPCWRTAVAVSLFDRGVN